MKLDEIVNRRLTAAADLVVTGGRRDLSLHFRARQNGFFPACPFRTLTGFTCPGCGSTRGLHRLLHGDVVAAFEFNPLLVRVVSVSVFRLGALLERGMRGRPLKENQLNAKYIWMLFAVILSFWIFRNTPVYPFPI